MVVILVEFVIVLIGLMMTAVAFYRIPKIPVAKRELGDYPKISVIIPARNEEKNLALLLNDLSIQTLPVFEIICIDDNSEDNTSEVAVKNGATLIHLNSKPKEWTGKSWACHNGAQAAKGQLLLFLDADVRLGPDGIRTLLSAYLQESCTISVQPFHKTQKVYEQFSLMCNLVQIAANGAAMKKPRQVGLYGPIILISHEVYDKIGGHESIKSSIIDDIALGMQLKKANQPFSLFVGDRNISFRMYAGGFLSLVQGWIKNMASGATQAPALVFVMVFFWLASLISVPIQIIKFIVLGNVPWLLTYIAIYLCWVVLLAVLSKQIGDFQMWSFMLFPIVMVVFLFIMIISALKKLFRLEVLWKGRRIRTDKAS